MDAPPSAPPAVAVVVTSDPGWWLEDCLRALAAQDYPNLSVLVVDAASGVDPTRRVAEVLPSAYVRRAAVRAGFAAGANEVLGVVEGASHYVFCHDDVALADDAVRLLVEEAFRSNAGVVSPKFVEWDAPDRLLAVGASADKGGVPVSFVERGELDQEQHDAVRDVFVAPSGCTLVRADLFATLNGFDGEAGLAGEELDLCWRAQIAGARVVVAPSAVVRHLEATARGLRSVDGTATAGSPAPPTPSSDPATVGGLDSGRAAEAQVRGEALAAARDAARVRAVLANYGPAHRARVIPQLAVATALEVVTALGSGSRARAAAALAPWRANLGRDKRRASRRRVSALRAVPDHEVRELQAHGNLRLRAVLRGTASQAADPLRATSVDLAVSWREGMRLTVSVWTVVIAVLLFGTRHLIGSHLATYGEFVPFPSPSVLARHAWSGWRTTGMGSPSPAPTAFWLLAGAGSLLLGHMGLLQRLLVLGMVPLGALGAFRLGRAFDSRRARLVTTVLYAANPLAYDALAGGHWSGMIAFGVMPWVLMVLARATRLAPFSFGSERVDAAAGPDRRWLARAVGLGVVLAAAGSFVPSLIGLAVAVALLLAVSSVLAGELGAALRAVGVAAAAAVTSALLLFPWAIGLLPPGGEWATVTRPTPGSAHPATFAQLLRFQTGPTGASVLGWALLVAAALPLLIGTGWRFAWAVRLWVVAIGSWVLAWSAGRGWLPFPPPPAEVLLVPGAVALATCAGLGLVAFEIDLRGYHFGWRQVVSTVAAAGAVFATLPVLGSAFDGRWHSPTSGVEDVLSWVPDKRPDGAFRVLWVGDPAVLPIAGWPAAPGLAYATSRDGLPDVTSSWPGSSRGATRLLAQGLQLADQGRTTQLGHLLAPLAVRYIVVVQRSAPAGQPGIARPSTPVMLSGLQSQVDLRRLDSDASLVVYENASWAPGRSVVPSAAVPAITSDDPRTARTVELGGSRPVLGTSHGPTSFAGPVPAGTVLLSEAPSPRWSLHVNGADAPREDAFGLANAFTVGNGGSATLSYHTAAVRRLALGVQALLWFVAIGWAWRARREERVAAGQVPGGPAFPGPGRIPLIPPAPIGVASPVGGGPPSRGPLPPGPPPSSVGVPT